MGLTLLGGTDLSGVDLSWSPLMGADLSGVKLTDANLYKANMSGGDLRKADLSGVKLTGANLHRVDLRDAIIDGITGYWLSGDVLIEIARRHSQELNQVEMAIVGSIAVSISIDIAYEFLSSRYGDELEKFFSKIADWGWGEYLEYLRRYGGLNEAVGMHEEA